MGYASRLDKAFEKAPVLPLTRHTKYILMSDCHRGVGNTNDNFLKNQHLYMAAMQHYYRNNYIYIELGDGDELWENRSLKQIADSHHPIFDLLESFHMAHRLYLLYGNHDMVKKKLSSVFLSGLILQDTKTGNTIYLTHGHQGDLLNSTFWKFSRFLVRYLWKPAERFGVLDPTSTAKNYHRKNNVEKRLSKWAEDHHRLLITGHTHRPRLGEESLRYCNTGSCVHPSGITAIEITNRCLSLVKWNLAVRENKNLYVLREVLSGPVCLDNFYTL